MTVRYIVLVGLVVSAHMMFACSPVAAGESGYRQHVEGFFELVEKGKPSEAIDKLYATNPYQALLSDQLEQLKLQFTSYAKLWGSYYTYEVLTEKTLGGRYVYMYVMAVYDRQPVFISFYFYKPKDQWVIQNFKSSAGEDVDAEIARQAQFHLWSHEVK